MTDRASLSPAALAATLADRGLLDAGVAPLPVTAEDDRPWFVSAVLGAAGWLAGVLTLSFTWLLLEPDTAAGAAMAGLVLLGAAFALYYAGRDSAFFGQLALAFSIAGQLTVIWAVADATESAAATAAFATLMQAGLLLALPNRFAKVLAAFFLCVAWTLTIRLGWWGEEAFVDGRADVALLPALAGWFAIWIPIILGVHALVALEAQWMATRWRQIARPALVGGIVGLSAATWVAEPFAVLRFWTPPSESFTNWLALWPLLATATALFAAACAYRLRDHALLGVAIAGALLHVVQFYYLLGVALLTKALVMLAVGAVLLLAARGLRGRTPNAEAADDAAGA